VAQESSGFCVALLSGHGRTLFDSRTEVVDKR